MKKRIVIISSVFLTLIAVSCKKKEVNPSTPPAAVIENNIENNFNVEVNLISSKNDDFALYFTEDNTTAFNDKNCNWKSVKGGGLEEKIIFNLSEEIIPTDIRFDFGLNKEQEYVEIKNILISYKGKNLEIKGSDFFIWFNENKDFDAKADMKNGSLKITKIGKDWKTPFYYPKKELSDAIRNLTVASK